MTYGRRYRCWAAALCLIAAHGCATRDALVNERLDRASGVTITTAAEPFVFARTDTRYSRSARDYVYLAPVSTNRQGLRDYYLWIGLATTLDRGYLAPETAIPSTLQIVAGGELMEFELYPWEDTAGTDMRVYETRVQMGTELAARITLNQLGLLVREAIDSIYLTGASSQQRFASWSSGDWSEFLRHEDAVAAARDSR